MRKCYLPFVIAATIAFIILPASIAQNETYTFWHYNISLDIGDQNVTVEPMTSSSDINSISRHTILRGDSPGDYAALYMFESRAGKGVGMEEQMWYMMKPICKAVRTREGAVGDRAGIIATGDARVDHGFGQKCYAGMVALSESGTGSTQYLAVLGHFLNETLNEHLVRTARIQYVGEG